MRDEFADIPFTTGEPFEGLTLQDAIRISA